MKPTPCTSSSQSNKTVKARHWKYQAHMRVCRRDGKHNIDEEPNAPTRYGIRGIPTMLLFKDGQLKATKVGATTKSNILSWIKENI